MTPIKPPFRRWHVADVAGHLRTEKGVLKKADCNTDEFQEWFHAGVRQCMNHPAPFEWHIVQGLQCPSCHPRQPEKNWRKEKKKKPKEAK